MRGGQREIVDYNSALLHLRCVAQVFDKRTENVQLQSVRWAMIEWMDDAHLSGIWGSGTSDHDVLPSEQPSDASAQSFESTLRFDERTFDARSRNGQPMTRDSLSGTSGRCHVAVRNRLSSVVAVLERVRWISSQRCVRLPAVSLSWGWTCAHSSKNAATRSPLLSDVQLILCLRSSSVSGRPLSLLPFSVLAVPVIALHLPSTLLVLLSTNHL